MNGGAIIVTATFGDGDNGWLQQVRRDHYPPERNHVPAHLTLLRQLPPSAEDEVRRRLAMATAGAPPPAMISGIIDLDGGTALRVESAALEEVRGDLAEAFQGLLSAQDRGPWTPHVTIQNKVARREAKALQARLRLDFRPRPLAIKGLAAWRYRDGPWEPIRAWPFRL